MVPSAKKVVINAGVGRIINNASGSKNAEELIKEIKKDISLITGQWPTETKAKKSISSFKLREGQTVGLKVTLRGKRMFDFIARLVNMALPRIRDFKGIPEKSIDAFGNLNIGIEEATIFPEVTNSVLKHPFGLQITIVTNDKHHERVVKLYKMLGFPIK